MDSGLVGGMLTCRLQFHSRPSLFLMKVIAASDYSLTKRDESNAGLRRFPLYCPPPSGEGDGWETVGSLVEAMPKCSRDLRAFRA